MQNNIEWIKKYADNARSDKKERKQNIIAIAGIVIAIVIGVANFCGITLQSIKQYF